MKPVPEAPDFELFLIHYLSEVKELKFRMLIENISEIEKIYF